MSKQGLFITFEGGEGSGKTTQINRLASSLTARGVKSITTREPGGTPEAERIRDLLVQRDGGNWTPLSEVLLFCAARVMHVERVIAPALAHEKVVICDRFTDSTVAYQGHGYGYDIEKIRDVDQLCLGGVKPDLTFILDIDVKEGLERSYKHLAGQKGYEQTEDRFERMDISFHEKLRQGFLKIAESEPERCRVIDATQSADDIAAQIAKIVAQKLEHA